MPCDQVGDGSPRENRTNGAVRTRIHAECGVSSARETDDEDVIRIRVPRAQTIVDSVIDVRKYLFAQAVVESTVWPAKVRMNVIPPEPRRETGKRIRR